MPVTSSSWYQKAVDSADRIQPAHTSPWKLAAVYALLSIAESHVYGDPATRWRSRPETTVVPHGGELLTVAEAAAMTKLPPSTLRYWRHIGTGGPLSFKLGRRIMYRRSDVENWVREAT